MPPAQPAEKAQARARNEAFNSPRVAEDPHLDPGPAVRDGHVGRSVLAGAAVCVLTVSHWWQVAGGKIKGWGQHALGGSRARRSARRAWRSLRHRTKLRSPRSSCLCVRVQQACVGERAIEYRRTGRAPLPPFPQQQSYDQLGTPWLWLTYQVLDSTLSRAKGALVLSLVLNLDLYLYARALCFVARVRYPRLCPPQPQLFQAALFRRCPPRLPWESRCR